MKHIGTKTIETGRLLLRRLTIDDTEMMYNNWAHDPEVTKYLRWAPHQSWRDTAEIVHQWTLEYDNPEFYQWGICEKHSGILMGTISLFPAEFDPAGWKIDTESYEEPWEIGYCLGRKWWNKGYMTEALDAVCKYWFAVVGGQWLVAAHANENVASGAVLMKAGFVYDHNAAYHKDDGTEVPCRAYHLLRKDI